MHKTDAANNVANEFSDGTPPLTPGTSLGAKWHNTVQRELVNVVENAGPGATLDDENDGQVLEALEATFGQLAAENTWTDTQNFNAQTNVNANLYVQQDVLVDGGIGANGTSIFQDVETQAAQLYSVTVLHAATLNETLAVTGASTLTGALTANGGATLRAATSSTATTPQTAVTLPNGYLSFAGAANPNSNVGFGNVLTGANMVKAWGSLSTAGGSSSSVTVNTGFNVSSATAPGTALVVTLATPLASGVVGVAFAHAHLTALIVVADISGGGSTITISAADTSGNAYNWNSAAGRNVSFFVLGLQ